MRGKAFLNMIRPGGVHGFVPAPSPAGEALWPDDHWVECGWTTSSGYEPRGRVRWGTGKRLAFLAIRPDHL